MLKQISLVLLFQIYFLNLLYAEGLESFLAKPDANFQWKLEESQQDQNTEISSFDLTSQSWKEVIWHHRVILIKPKELKHPDTCLLFITGSKSASRDAEFLKDVADKSNAYTAVIGSVPNQPIFNRKEDALLAYSFKQYIETGDESWPVIFPMVKSVQRAMDLISAVTKKDNSKGVSRFVLSGASKRGWTTWLTGASDMRVVAIAPIVFDMLNMRAQIDLAAKAYGQQSDKIKDYTEMGLIDSIDHPRNKKMRDWVDPYSYLSKLTMPKLIILGTNDPYWVVDAQRNYFQDLPGQKILYQVANGDHHISGQADVVKEITSFFINIASGNELPELKWKFNGNLCEKHAAISLVAGQAPKSLKLWRASSKDRDFRDEKWTSKQLIFPKDSTNIEMKILSKEDQYSAFMAEAEISLQNGNSMQYFSPVFVLPDIDCK